jgi:hypothetical protein
MKVIEMTLDSKKLIPLRSKMVKLNKPQLKMVKRVRRNLKNQK